MGRHTEAPATEWSKHLMAINEVNTSEFEISVDGNVTGEKWHGKFTVKTLLSLRDELARDAKRREFLGPINPQFADARTLDIANAFSELFVRIVKAPAWWMEAGNGLDLLDDNVIREVYNKAVTAENEVLEKLSKQGKEAEEALRKHAEANKVA